MLPQASRQQQSQQGRNNCKPQAAEAKKDETRMRRKQKPSRQTRCVPHCGQTTAAAFGFRWKQQLLCLSSAATATAVAHYERRQQQQQQMPMYLNNISCRHRTILMGNSRQGKMCRPSWQRDACHLIELG